MKRILITMLLYSVWFLASYAQNNLNIAQFFSDSYKSEPFVTFVEVVGEKLQIFGLTVYKSIVVDNNESLSEKIEKAVKKDSATAKSKEVIYRKGHLYFGMYYLGGVGAERRYMYYLNQRAIGKDKTMLIYIEGAITEEKAKSLIKK